MKVINEPKIRTIKLKQKRNYETLERERERERAYILFDSSLFVIICSFLLPTTVLGPYIELPSATAPNLDGNTDIICPLISLLLRQSAALFPDSS